MNCLNCKWFYNGNCNNKDTRISALIEQDGTSYIEDGILIETLKENLNFKDIIETVIVQLQEQEIIKKIYTNNWNKIHNKIDNDYIENEIIENIEQSLSNSIINYFNNSNIKNKIIIEDPANFKCNYWE